MGSDLQVVAGPAHSSAAATPESWPAAAQTASTMRELKRQEFQARLQYAYRHHRLAVCGVKMPRPRLLVKLFCKVDTLTWIGELPTTARPNLGGGPLLAALSQGAGDGAAHAAGILRTSRFLI